MRERMKTVSVMASTKFPVTDQVLTLKTTTKGIRSSFSTCRTGSRAASSQIFRSIWVRKRPKEELCSRKLTLLYQQHSIEQSWQVFRITWSLRATVLSYKGSDLRLQAWITTRRWCRILRTQPQVSAANSQQTSWPGGRSTALLLLQSRHGPKVTQSLRFQTSPIQQTRKGTSSIRSNPSIVEQASKSRLRSSRLIVKSRTSIWSRCQLPPASKLTRWPRTLGRIYVRISKSGMYLKWQAESRNLRLHAEERAGKRVRTLREPSGVVKNRSVVIANPTKWKLWALSSHSRKLGAKQGLTFLALQWSLPSRAAHKKLTL